MKIALLIECIVAMLFGFCNKQDEGRHNLIISSSFESTTNPFTGWANNQHCCDYSLNQSTDKASDSAKSLKLEVRSTDPQVSGSIRSELVIDATGAETEGWYGFNMYLEDWIRDDAGEHVFQWHPNSAGGSAVASLWTSMGRYQWVAYSPGVPGGYTYTDLGPIVSNQWVSWVVHVKFSDNNTGITQVWKNGKLVLDKKNSVTCPAGGAYFKLGINKFGWGYQTSSTTKRVLYFDEVRVGNKNAGYNDVKPGN